MGPWRNVDKAEPPVGHLVLCLVEGGFYQLLSREKDEDGCTCWVDEDNDVYDGYEPIRYMEIPQDEEG